VIRAAGVALAEREIVLHIKTDSLLYALCVMASLYMASAQTYAGQASLQWDYTASGAAGFVLYCGTSSGNYTTRIDVGNTTIKKIPLMEPLRGTESLTRELLEGSDSAESLLAKLTA